LQVLPTAQAVPQVPQLLPSILELVQREPHCVSPVGHDNVQVPPTHFLPSPHTTSQPPQFRLSVVVSLHTEPHFVNEPHTVVQVPAEQT
jgi:hypothetical protein